MPWSRPFRLDQQAQGLAELRLHKQAANGWYLATRIEHLSPSHGIALKLLQGLRDAEYAVHVLVHGKAVLRMLDGRFQHLSQGLGPVGFYQFKIAIDNSRH